MLGLAKTSAALFLCTALGIGCGVNPVPTDQVGLSERAISAARSAGAAPAELRLAEEKLALGKRWIAAGDNKPARWLTEQSEVDAEVAMLKAMSVRAREKAARETAEFRALRTKSAS